MGEKFIINAALMKADTAEIMKTMRIEGVGEVSIPDSADGITKDINRFPPNPFFSRSLCIS